MLDNIVYILLIVAVIVYSVFYFKRSFEIRLKYFLIYLVITLLLEILSAYLYSKNKDTIWVYHILLFFEFNSLLLFFREITESKSTKKFTNILICVFNLVYLLSSMYYYEIGSYLVQYNAIASVFGSVLITISLVFYYKEFLVSDRILNYKKSISFWITFGLSVYYLGFIPFTSIINLMSDIPSELKDYFFMLPVFLSIFMYSCFIFGALWSQKQV